MDENNPLCAVCGEPAGDRAYPATVEIPRVSNVRMVMVHPDCAKRRGWF